MSSNPEKYSPLFGHAKAHHAWEALDKALAECKDPADYNAVDYLRGCIRCAIKTKDGKARLSAITRAHLYEWLTEKLEESGKCPKIG